MPRKIVAVTDPMVEKVSGVMTFWELSGSVDHAKLTQAWDEQGLDPAWVLNLPSPADALRRAVQTQHEGRRLVRPLKGDRGWAIVREEVLEGERKLKHSQEFSVTLTDWGSLEFEGSINGEAKEIQAAYETALYELTHADIGGWLVSLARDRMAGVSLRGSGGIYFILREYRDTWDKVKATLAAVGQTIHKIPAMDAADTALAVLSALEREAEEFTQQIDEKLRKGMGKRAIATQQDAVRDMERKLERYVGIIGNGLEGVKVITTKLSATLQRAELTAEKSKVQDMIADMA